MTIKLGMFTMPFHHPSRDYADLLEEDQEAIVLADRLGFSEAFVGEHFSSWSERITSPLIFLATVINRTSNIRLGTGVINMPHVHPATVAETIGCLLKYRDDVEWVRKGPGDEPIAGWLAEVNQG